MASLPVREIVLYKSGIGFFVRAGQHAEDSLTLNFRADEINDVLKSLAVFDQAGGQIVSIGYDTPKDLDHRNSLSSIRLSDAHSLRDLVRDLRGRDVTLHAELAPGEISLIRGQMIGIEVEVFEGGERVTSISVLRENGEVMVCAWSALRGLTLHEAGSQNDLTYVLETSAGDDPRRSVNVRLSPAADGTPHDLIVYYVAPAASWRVSYRAVATRAENGEEGRLIFQGWGLFDNRLEEDLNDVRVTLIAGQPIAFVYELYASHIPERPTIQDETRIAAAPVEYDGSLPLSEVPEPAASAPMMMASNMSFGGSLKRREAAPLPRRPADMASQAETKDAGEFFEYQVAMPVSVRRGESALVPIVQREIPYRRELLYNGQKLPKHPVAALRFSNATGLTLERGPVTIIEDGGYRGDAIVPFSRDGAEVYLAFAVELGITVVESHNRAVHTSRISLQDGMLFHEQYALSQTDYELVNRTSREQIVTIEALKTQNYELFETPAPSEETGRERRWRVSLPAQSRRKFVRKERELMNRFTKVSDLKHQHLVEYLSQGWIDQALHDRLKEIVDVAAEIQTVEARHQQLIDKRQVIFSRQEQYRGNLAALSNQGKEAILRDRILANLTQTQDELEALDRDEKHFHVQIVALSERFDALIAAL